MEELIKCPKQTKLVDRTDQPLIPFSLKSSSCDSLIILKGKQHVTVISITRWLPQVLESRDNGQSTLPLRNSGV